MNYVVFTDNRSGSSHEFIYKVNRSNMFDFIQNCLLVLVITVNESHIVTEYTRVHNPVAFVKCTLIKHKIFISLILLWFVVWSSWETHELRDDIGLWLNIYFTTAHLFIEQYPLAGLVQYCKTESFLVMLCVAWTGRSFQHSAKRLYVDLISKRLQGTDSFYHPGFLLL